MYDMSPNTISGDVARLAVTLALLATPENAGAGIVAAHWAKQRYNEYNGA